MLARPNRLTLLWRFVQREKLHRMVVALVVLFTVSGLTLRVLEPVDKSLADWLWWSVVTMTTVGYGDVTPTTFLGRAIGVGLMFFGIGLLGTFTATLAGIVVTQKLRTERGLITLKLKDHLILCKWNGRARDILNELRSDPRSQGSPVVLIADLGTKPVEDEHLHFVKGSVEEATLPRAGIMAARAVVVLGDDAPAPTTRDAQVVLATLTTESLNPDVYAIVELVSEVNVPHCKRAKADEVIVASEVSSHLIASSALDHGISNVVSELLSTRSGNNLKKTPVPADLVGEPFLEVLTRPKRRDGTPLLAVQRGSRGEVVTNSEASFRVEAGDQLVLASPRSEV